MIKAGPWDYLWQAGAALSLVSYLWGQSPLAPMLHWGLHRYEGTTIVPKYKAHSGIGPALNRADPYHDTHSLIHAHTNQPTNQSYLRSECSQNDRIQRSPVVPYNQIRPEVGKKKREGREGREGKGREETGGRRRRREGRRMITIRQFQYFWRGSPMLL